MVPIADLREALDLLHGGVEPVQKLSAALDELESLRATRDVLAEVFDAHRSWQCRNHGYTPQPPCDCGGVWENVRSALSTSKPRGTG